MTTLAVYAVVLLAAVLLSEFAQRTVISTAALFLVAGFFAGGAGDLIDLGPGQTAVGTFAEIALVSVLFTDGMRIGVRELISAWRLPGRALLVGMPITFGLTAGLAYLLTDLSVTQALLVGAALAPTDPVFAAAIVGREEVPHRLRHLLNVESGLNDGLALPVVVVLLAWSSAEPIHAGSLVGEIAFGVAMGIAIPWIAVKLERRSYFAASEAYEPLLAFAVVVLVFALAKITHANEYLAAFTAGVTIASVSESLRKSFHEFGEIVTELLKLGALLLLGALMRPSFFTEFSWSAYAFVALVLLAVRPIALSVALLGHDLGKREWFAAAWFGPKGFASVVYGLLILKEGGPGAEHVFHLIAIVVGASILAHSSTDVIVARWFGGEPPPRGHGEEELQATGPP